jgi:F0F1-type ATP synthase assembly protein I
VDETEARSVDELIAEAEAVANERVPLGQFVASLDWSLPGIARSGGAYASQSTGLIQDVLDGAGMRGGSFDAAAVRALASAAAVAAREGDRPESVATVHGLLVSGGLLPPGPAPEPRPKTVIRPGGAPGRTPASSRAEPTPSEALDPALDPEIARITQRIAPRSTASQTVSLLGLGWAIALSLVGGVLIGLWLDGRFGTSPILTMVGLVIGLAGAFLAGRQLVEQSRAR